MKALALLTILIVFPLLRAIVHQRDRRRRMAAYHRAIWPERG